jgi:SNF family Na+-dependent transporter
LGQIFKKGPVEVFEMIRKKFLGVGWAAVLTSWFISIYYAIILCWSYYYFFLSFNSPLPWSYEALVENKENNSSFKSYNITNNSTDSDPDENYMNLDFFKKEVLRLSEGIHQMGSLNTEMVLCLIITYLSIFLCIYEGIKSSSKVVYITCPAPLILMLVLLIK